MKIAAIIVATAAAATPADTQETRITLSTEDAARCQAQGGCGIVTRAWVLEQMRKAFEAGHAECKGSI